MPKLEFKLLFVICFFPMLPHFSALIQRLKLIVVYAVHAIYIIWFIFFSHELLNLLINYLISVFKSNDFVLLNFYSIKLIIVTSKEGANQLI